VSDKPDLNPAKLPGTFKQFVARFPELAECHQRVGETVEKLGPLDRKTCELIKIGICLGAQLESAMRSHVRRATEAGATETEIEQALMLGMNTIGFPQTIAGWSWAQIQFQRDRAEKQR
jgi:alkylhydroperoxidase/carboxymuconolactone decarboxylase family protein YurZ